MSNIKKLIPCFFLIAVIVSGNAEGAWQKSIELAFVVARD